MVDPNTVRRIVRLAEVAPGDPVVEIGAGVGSLTVALAEAGAGVTAVEIDRHLLPALEEVVGPLGVEVVAGDALTARLGPGAGAATTGGPWSPTSPTTWGPRIVLELLDDVSRRSTACW